jgi:hypothetical protein
MNNLTREEIALERTKWGNKFFDVAEKPIKDWLSELIGAETKTLFQEDNIGVENTFVNVGGTTYKFYLQHGPRDSTKFHIDRNLFNQTPEMKQAVSLLYDAVRNIYPAIVKTMDTHKEYLISIVPMFYEEGMYFHFKYINLHKLHMELYAKSLIQINTMLRTADEKTQQHLIEERTKITNESRKITKEMIDDGERKAEQKNNELQYKPVLHIGAEVYQSNPIDNIPLAMQNIGPKYYDPEEDDLSKNV